VAVRNTVCGVPDGFTLRVRKDGAEFPDGSVPRTVNAGAETGNAGVFRIKTEAFTGKKLS
jgi:hypothetical protein